MELNIPAPDCVIAKTSPTGYINYLLHPVDQKQEGKIPMHVNTQNVAVATQGNVEATQRDFMVRRLNRIYADLYDALRKQFYLDGVSMPGTAKELIDAIKNDKFELDTKKIEDAELSGDIRWYNTFFGIIWNGGNTRDVDGFKKAEKALNKAKQDVTDTVTLAPMEEARKAFEKFKAWTYSD